MADSVLLTEKTGRARKVATAIAAPALLAGVLHAGPPPPELPAPARPETTGVSADRDAAVRRVLENRRALIGYEWRSRGEIRQGEKVVSVRVEGIGFDADGVLSPTVISLEPPELKPELNDKVEGLLRLARGYLVPSGLGLEEAMRGAQAGPGQGENAGRIRLQADSFNQGGDSVIWWMEAETRRFLRLEVAAKWNRHPVRIEAEYGRLPDGPDAILRAAVRAPKENLEIVFEFSEFLPAEKAS